MALGLSLRITNITAKIAAVVTTGLQMWHKMTVNTWTGSDRLPDSSDNTNTAALYTGRGFDLDGVNDDIVIGNISELNFDYNEPLTVSCFVNISSSETTAQIISKKSNSSPFTGYEVSISSGKIRYAKINDAGTNLCLIESDLTYNDDTWHYLVVTDDGSSDAAGITIYIDGVSVAVSIVSDSLSATFSNTYIFSIGSRNGADSHMLASISNVKIFDIELSAGQVAELYANPEQVLPTGATAANLVGWWPMADGDSAGIVLDGSGNNNNATISGATEIFSLPSPVSQPSLKGVNMPLWFDGSDDYVPISSQSNLSLANSDFTIVIYLMVNSLAVQYLYTQGDQAVQAKGMHMAISSNKFRFSLYDDDLDGTTTPEIGQLYCIAGTFDDTSKDQKIFVSGVEENSRTASGSFTGNNVNTLGAWYAPANYTASLICYVAIFDSKLSSAELTEINSGGIPFDFTTDSGDYASSANLQGYWKNTGNTDADWTDLSGNSNDGTVNGSPVTIYIPEGTTAGEDLLGATITNANTGELILNADGYTETADDATLDITDELTLEAWVKPFSVATEQTIIGKDLAYALKLTSGAKPAFSKYTTTETETATTSTTLSVDAWYHLAATYDGVNVRIYINGAIDTTTAVSGAIDTNASVLLTGALTSSTEQFDGYIDSAKVYDGTVKSADEILQNYNAEIADHS